MSLNDVTNILCIIVLSIILIYFLLVIISMATAPPYVVSGNVIIPKRSPIRVGFDYRGIDGIGAIVPFLNGTVMPIQDTNKTFAVGTKFKLSCTGDNVYTVMALRDTASSPGGVLRVSPYTTVSFSPAVTFTNSIIGCSIFVLE